ncbi:hypothetical protein JKF63_07367 [Porcisia hertigi]|uniref:Uncharacterized protein n=1 Tax=Porcisia hertigi TaxID=2761500 RepID=A0A836LKS1_9TRYP|nr:hypothetical protein JKF63_07367 [Porcisia hertigi]
MRPSSGARGGTGGGGANSRGSPHQHSRTSPPSSSTLPIYSFGRRRRDSVGSPVEGNAHNRLHIGGPVHTDPAVSRVRRAAPPVQPKSTPQHTTDASAHNATPSLPSASSVAVPPPSTLISADLVRSLNACVQESLAGYLYPDAIEFAQHLFDLEASYAHLHLLAHCYTVSGATSTAYRLLQHYYPFMELHVTRPRTAGASSSFATGPAGMASASRASGGGGASGALPFDARRTWTASGNAHPSKAPFSSSVLSADGFELSYETVDLQAQWDCQYLLGVCCYRTQHYEDGAKVLSQLLYVNQQLTTASHVLRRRLKQLCQQKRQAAVGVGTNEDDDNGLDAAIRATKKELQAHAFVTDARNAQVLYWLGLCDKKRQRPVIAAEHLRRAYVAYPTRLDAFKEYVHLEMPSEPLVQPLLTLKESLMNETDQIEDDAVAEPQQHSQRPPQRRGRDAPDTTVVDVDADIEDEEQRTSWHAAAAPVSGGGCHNNVAAALPSPTQAMRTSPSSVHPTASQIRTVQEYLRPFLHAAFLGLTYRCPSAVKTIHTLLAQEQQQQQAAEAARASVSSSVAANLPSPARASVAPPPSSSVPSRKGPEDGSSSTETRCAKALVASGTSPWLLRQLALAYFHNGDVQESADTFERLLQIAPWELTDPALIFYSTALWHLKSEGALGSLAQRLTDAEPLSATTLCVVANAYSLIKDPRDALVMLKRAVQVAPTLAYAHALYGYELLGQDNREEAEASFSAALALDKSLYIAHAGLGECSMRKENLHMARHYYVTAATLNQAPAMMNRVALTFHRQSKSKDDLKTAANLYKESLEQYPNNITARRQRADVLMRLNQPEDALEELKVLLVQCPGEAVVYITLAECMVCLRRPREALKFYQTAMHLDPRREGYVQGCIDKLVAAKML